MPPVLRLALLRQLDTAWKLATFHVRDLTTAECLWRPASRGPHVHRNAGGDWRADWPEDESYAAGPPSIAWITWHVGFWWSMALDHSAGEGTLTRDHVVWPGDADSVRSWLAALHAEWVTLLDGLPDEEFASTRLARWPFRERPFADIAAWVNVELMKNAAEIGYARFLYATRGGEP